MPELPFLDLACPAFSTRGAEVLDARAQGWCARTAFGIAVLRHREAGLLLRDRRLRQGSYAWPVQQGLTGSFIRFWTNSVIAQEGEEHKALRRVAMAALSEGFIASLEPGFTKTATTLADEMPSGACFVERFSEPFAGRAIALLLGLPPEEAAALASDANTLGLAMGPTAKQHEVAINAACDRLFERADRLLGLACDAETPTYVTRLADEARRQGTMTRDALLNLIVISIFGGVDTTRAQLGFAMALFARHPDQWALLRADPSLVPQAIDEVVRTWPTTTWATREALEDIDFGGITIRQGDNVHVLVHATATDPLIDAADGFDITRRRKAHFGFGGGAHHCLGQLVARTDMAAALRALLERWAKVDFAAPPEWLPDTGNTSPRHLPLAIVRSNQSTGPRT